MFNRRIGDSDRDSDNRSSRNESNTFGLVIKHFPASSRPHRSGVRLKALRYVIPVLALVHTLTQVEWYRPSRRTAGLLFFHGQEAGAANNRTAAAKNVNFDQIVSHDRSTNVSIMYQNDFNQTVPPPPLPSLKSIRRKLKGGDRTAGQDLLDFAVIGHAKCGTTTMMRWLEAHPEVQIFPREVTVMQTDPKLMISRLLTNLPRGKFRRGYKSPSDVDSPRIPAAFRKYFPKTKLIVGIRHPVLWFQSFYNFRVQNGAVMPPTTRMHRTCAKGQSLVCAFRAAFHNHLARFGKTNMTDAREMQLFTSFDRRHRIRRRAPYTPNKIFLYDAAQLGDDNATRVENLQKDFQRYLGLRTALPKPLHIKPGMTVSAEEQAIRDSRKIDICDAVHAPLREQLIEIGKNASIWIAEYFLDAPDSIVANREHLESILETYKRDPCAT